MTSPLVPSLSDDLNLGGPVIESSMTLGQLRLIARCINTSLMNAGFHQSLSADELEEANAIVEMFNDPELETAERGMHHGFCL